VTVYVGSNYKIKVDPELNLMWTIYLSDNRHIKEEADIKMYRF
jgi:hypothetical protein